MKLSRNKISKLLKINNQSRKQYKKNKRQRNRNKSFRKKKPFNIRNKSLKAKYHLKHKKKILKGGDDVEMTPLGNMKPDENDQTQPLTNQPPVFTTPSEVEMTEFGKMKPDENDQTQPLTNQPPVSTTKPSMFGNMKKKMRNIANYTKQSLKEVTKKARNSAAGVYNSMLRLSTDLNQKFSSFNLNQNMTQQEFETRISETIAFIENTIDTIEESKSTIKQDSAELKQRYNNVLSLLKSLKSEVTALSASEPEDIKKLLPLVNNIKSEISLLAKAMYTNTFKLMLQYDKISGKKGQYLTQKDISKIVTDNKPNNLDKEIIIPPSISKDFPSSPQPNQIATPNATPITSQIAPQNAIPIENQELGDTSPITAQPVVSFPNTDQGNVNVNSVNKSDGTVEYNIRIVYPSDGSVAKVTGGDENNMGTVVGQLVNEVNDRALKKEEEKKTVLEQEIKQLQDVIDKLSVELTQQNKETLQNLLEINSQQGGGAQNIYSSFPPPPTVETPKPSAPPAQDTLATYTPPPEETPKPSAPPAQDTLATYTPTAAVAGTEENCRKQFCERDEPWKQCYRKGSLKHHPDKGGNEEMFKDLTKCNNILKNKEEEIPVEVQQLESDPEIQDLIQKIQTKKEELEKEINNKKEELKKIEKNIERLKTSPSSSPSVETTNNVATDNNEQTPEVAQQGGKYDYTNRLKPEDLIFLPEFMKKVNKLGKKSKKQRKKTLKNKKRKGKRKRKQTIKY